MRPESKELLMDAWRQDLRDTNYFESRAVQQHSGIGNNAVRRWEVDFRNRVMKRLQERGWLLKEIAFLWGLSKSRVYMALRHVKPEKD